MSSLMSKTPTSLDSLPGVEGSLGASGPEDTRSNSNIEPCLEQHGLQNYSNLYSGFYFLQLTYFIDSRRYNTTPSSDSFCFVSDVAQKK